MNIEVQCCGLIILALLWFFYFKQRTLGLYSERLFLTTMAFTTVCVVLDILSIIAIVNMQSIPGWLLAFACKTYIVSLVWVGYFGLVYSSTDINDGDEQKQLVKIYTAMVLLGTVIIYALPIRYYLDGNVVYTYGPSCMATYVFALLFVLATLYKVAVRGKKMNPKRRKAVVIWMIIWIIAAVIQFLNAKLLLVGFASVLGMVILFFELENPEANLDRETGAFNAHALVEYMKQLYAMNEKFSAILIVLTESTKANENDDARQDIIMQEVINFLEKNKEVRVFKTLEKEIALIFRNKEQMQEVFDSVKEWIKEKYFDLDPYYVLLQDSSLVRNPEEIFSMMHFFRVEGKKRIEERIVLLDEKRIAKMREREVVEAMILSAIEEDRIEVFYQPIYSTKKKKFVSAEALVRIREKDGKIIPPGVFIPIAETTGLIWQIGEIVFDKTCRFIKENNLREYYGIEYVEVNLSVKQCEGRELADLYIGIMKKYDLDPSNINLEITESASIQARHILLENMHILIDYGVSFSLDDFGNGESNLNYIVDMPVSLVKFDRDMSQAYFANQKAKFVMEAAMHMIHDMELKIVSEGVETKEQMETIVELGIDYIQGYYFSKPLPENQFLQFVSVKNSVVV